MRATNLPMSAMDEVAPKSVPFWMKVFGLIWPLSLVLFILWIILFHNGGPADIEPGDRKAAVWWGPSDTRWWGAVVGTGVGMLGGLLGTLCGIAGSLAGTGKSRAAAMVIINIVIAGFSIAGIAGGVALIAGFVAMSQDQPWHVQYPLFLIGGICTLVFGALSPWMAWMKRNVIAKRYEMNELRKMRSVDAG